MYSVAVCGHVISVLFPLQRLAELLRRIQRLDISLNILEAKVQKYT